MAASPLSDLLLLAFITLGFFIQRFTALGNHVYALGGNEAVLRQEGLSAARLQFFVFGFSGFCVVKYGLVSIQKVPRFRPYADRVSCRFISLKPVRIERGSSRRP